MRICLVACSKTKGNLPTSARDLYTSPLFRLSRAWAERYADRWFILSAQHYVLHPEKVINPYDRTIESIKREHRARYFREVTNLLRQYVKPKDDLTILAGSAYYSRLTYPPVFDIPLEGMGIGQRMAWLKKEMAKP